MSDANIDQNDRNELIAYNETTGRVERVRVDAVLGALLVYGVVSDSNTPTTYNRSGIDGNGRNTLSAFNEISGGIEALRCSVNGDLLITSV